ncbi:histone deacetylase [Burkholderia pseudomallei]|nr:histone deacetylase [Burkholderia pseudomallei]
MGPRRRAGPLPLATHRRRAGPLPLATHRRRACRSMHLARRQAARFDRAVRIGMSFGR